MIFQKTSRRSTGFTLVELLVVVAIIGMLVGLLLPAMNAVRTTARRAQCKSRMRQIGIGLHAYAEARRGKLPQVHGHGADDDQSWIFQLAPYLEYVDAVRVCPDDPEGDFRLQNQLTSYVLNGYLAELEDVEGEHDHVEGDQHAHDHGDHDHEHADGRFNNLGKMRSTSTTILLFEAAAGAHVDHVDSFEWFIDEHVDAGTVFDEVSAEVAVARHGGSAANYLFADGHVETIDVDTIRRWCRSGDDHNNFALPR